MIVSMSYKNGRLATLVVEGSSGARVVWDEAIDLDNADAIAQYKQAVFEQVAGTREWESHIDKQIKMLGAMQKVKRQNRATHQGQDGATATERQNGRWQTQAMHNTDAGNSARLARRHGDSTRYCGPWQRWILWASNRWAADERNEIDLRAKGVALSIFGEAGAGIDPTATGKWAVKSQSRERIRAMIDLAKSELSIVPGELDSDPMLLNAQNGTIDLRTGRIRPHDRADYCTKVANASYTEGAKAPTFMQFMARIFRTHPALIEYMQRAIGYAATGSTAEQVLFFLHGSGANGKTSLLDAVTYALGDYAGRADRELLMASDHPQHPTNIADLQGRRLVICSETNEGRRWDEAKLKDLTGETVLKARVMRGDFYEFNATHKLFLYSNHKPAVRGTDNGFWRRMRLVPFVEVIGDDEKDPDLLSKLKSEADGILSWIVEGCLAWQREGLGIPPEVAAATAEYRRDSDSIGLFIDERCLTGDRLKASACDLYSEYTKWCESNGEHPLSQKRLGMELGRRGLESDRDSYSGRKIWVGIGLRDGGETC